MIRTMIDTFMLQAIKIQMKQLSSMHTTLASYTHLSACVCNNMQSHEDEIRQYLLPHFRHF